MSKTALNAARSFGIMIVALMMWAGAATAQTASTSAVAAQATTPAQTPAQAQAPRRQIRRVPAPPARVTVIRSESPVAPQVVTIVHRLSGVKMLRLLLRQAGESGTLETIDPETFTNDAHASIIAGWALNDGKTIAARLPQAAAEIEFNEFENWGPVLQARAGVASSLPTSPPRLEPDLTVVTSDGRKLRAHLIGLDAETGLSVLQVNIAVIPPPTTELLEKLTQGQGVQIFAPEGVTPEGELSRITYVKVSKTDATVSNLVPANSGSLQRLTVRGAKLSPAVIGGIACDQTGSTVGIVESIEGNDARIVSAETIRAATRRVLDRRASVPRPLLGVRGEPVELAARAAFLANGWRDDQLKELIQEQVGILLTLVMPQTPASIAKLQPGDVIVRVNQNEVRSAEEFSKLLGEAGSGEQVEFTVKRPDAAAPLSIPVRLGASFAPVFEWRFEMPAVSTPFMGLQRLGIEAMALRIKAASQLGAQNGLLVVAVQPQSAAARGGVREGDVIESIDGRRAARGVWTVGPQFARQKKHILSIVRDREKKQVVLEGND